MVLSVVQTINWYDSSLQSRNNFFKLLLVSPVPMFVCLSSNLASTYLDRISPTFTDRIDLKFGILKYLCKPGVSTINWYWHPGRSSRIVSAGSNSSTVNSIIDLNFATHWHLPICSILSQWNRGLPAWRISCLVCIAFVLSIPITSEILASARDTT